MPRRFARLLLNMNCAIIDELFQVKRSLVSFKLDLMLMTGKKGTHNLHNLNAGISVYYRITALLSMVRHPCHM